MAKITAVAIGDTGTQAKDKINDAIQSVATDASLTGDGNVGTELSVDDTQISITASQVSDFDTEVSNNASVVANTAKVTNATHTGEVTGSGALTVDKTAITGKSAVTAESGDFVLISDTGDTGNLKKVDVVDFKNEYISIACSDLTTDLTTGTSKAYFRMPFSMTVTDVRASVLTAPTGSVLTVDINEGGVSILSTKITIDATEKTSTTAATPPVISDASIADDAEITIDIDGVGSSTAGAGLVVTIIGNR